MEQDDIARWGSAVAATLRAERGVAGLNQVEASERAGIARSSYRLYEQGKRQPDAIQLAALAEAFGVPFVYLLGEIDRRARTAVDASG